MPYPHLEFFDGQGRRIVPLQGERFTVGRRTDNDLHLLHHEVSREHAEILRVPDGYLLRDRGSRFGTFVNGERVQERKLADGDRLRFGGEFQPEMLFLEGRAEDLPSRSTTLIPGELRLVSSLLESLRALGSRRVLDEVLAMVLDSAIELSGAERAFIMLGEPGGPLEFKMGRHRGRAPLPGSEFETSRRIPVEVFATGESRFVTDMLDADLAQAHLQTVAWGIRTVFCMPLRLVALAEGGVTAREEDRLIGVLYLDSRERSSLLSGAMRDVLETLAREAAVAIDNARLYREFAEKERLESELRVAAEIQQALLPPRRRQGPGYEAAGINIPCQAIGGDFFDYLDLPGGRVGFALGDVSGKGPPAALLAAVVQGMLYSQAEAEAGPAVTVGRLNRALSARSVSWRFVTIAYAVLAPNGVLTTCNGGHNPLLLLRPDGTTTSLGEGGTILGVFPDAAYAEREIQLAPGDMLLLYSDGVNEATDAKGEEFGDERLAACAREAHHEDPTAFLDRLMHEVHTFTGSVPQMDDITALVVRYAGIS